MKQENQLPLRGGRTGHAIPTAGKGDNDDGITPLPSVATMLAKPTILEGKPSPPVGSSRKDRPAGYQFGRKRVIPRVNSPTKLVQPDEAVKEHGLSRILTAIWSRRCFVRVASWALPIVLFIMQIVHTPSTPSIVESHSHMAESSCHSDRGYTTEDMKMFRVKYDHVTSGDPYIFFLCRRQGCVEEAGRKVRESVVCVACLGLCVLW